MTYLLYGILNTPAVPLEAMAGLKGQPVALISVNGLSAAVSMLPCTEGIQGIGELMDYRKVVETLHFCQGVIPMRYGCCFDGAAGIERLLQERRIQYETLLGEICDKVEMGITVLLPERTSDDETLVEPSPPKGAAQGRGREYLQCRRTHYQAIDRATRHCTAMAGHYGRIFAHVCDRYKFEAHKEKPLLSLYFLVPKGQVGAFRAVFEGRSDKEKDRLLMSGPWPPYNFAC